jgi:hypothetical protein
MGIWFAKSPFFSQLSVSKKSASAPLTTEIQTVQESAQDNISSPELTLKKSEPQFSPETLSKVKLLKEILHSKNDNDPRMDSEFKVLSPELKQALNQLYDQLSKESLNERGSIVFILSKDLKTTEDLKIFNKVLVEEVCLSFADCQKLPLEGNDSHLDSINAVSLLYPQLVALNRLENLIHKEDFFSHTDDYIREVREVLQNATESKDNRISQKAKKLLAEVLNRRR